MPDGTIVTRTTSPAAGEDVILVPEAEGSIIITALANQPEKSADASTLIMDIAAGWPRATAEAVNVAST